MGPRKVVIDCDPGIDDALALALALFDPRLEVAAVTATAGNVSAELATRNVQAIVEWLDPPRLPRLGAAATEQLPRGDGRRFNGEDGLGNIGLPCSELARQHPADKIICDEARAAPGEVTLVCLGPLTNLARALQREPALATQLGRAVIVGGSVNGVGNITPCAEFNIFCDPEAARTVFRSPLTKSVVPLDVTSQVVWTLDLLSQLPPEETRVGSMLRRALPFAFRAHRQHLGMESIHVHDVVAIAALLHPELFHSQELSADVETSGELTVGATIFDRRPARLEHSDLEVALEVDGPAVTDFIVRGLAEAGRLTG